MGGLLIYTKDAQENRPLFWQTYAGSYPSTYAHDCEFSKEVRMKTVQSSPQEDICAQAILFALLYFLSSVSAETCSELDSGLKQVTCKSKIFFKKRRSHCGIRFAPSITKGIFWLNKLFFRFRCVKVRYFTNIWNHFPHCWEPSCWIIWTFSAIIGNTLCTSYENKWMAIQFPVNNCHGVTHSYSRFVDFYQDVVLCSLLQSAKIMRTAQK